MSSRWRKLITRIAAFIFALLPLAAFGQQFPTVPDHSVLGRIGTGSSSGPSQAIPWNTLFSSLLNGTNTFSGNAYFGSGSPWVDVKSGANGCTAAVGNGSTDDSAAIQCQINWMNTNLGGGTINFSPGNYHVASTITVKGGIFLQGNGRFGTIISANSDITVIAFDAATCTRSIGMSDIFVSGYQNAGATQDTVTVGSNCPATISRNYVWGGHHALNTAGTDGTYTENFFCGWTGDNVFSTGANWYISNKLDSCGNPSTANGFEQGTTSFTAENYLYRVDLSCGTCTNSVKINDGAGTHAITYFYGPIASAPIVVSNAKMTAFIGGEFGSTSFSGAGNISIQGAIATGSAITPSGGTYNCAGNFGFTCPTNVTSIVAAGSSSGSTTLQASATASGTLTLPAATDTLTARATTDTLTNKTISGASNTLSNIGNSSLTNSAATVAGQTCTLGSTCGLGVFNNSLGSPVTMTTLGTYYDGPSVAQGTTGMWFASGTAAITQSANVNDIVTCKLWDGTTVIDSDVMIGPVSSGTVSHHLSGYLASPAGNLKISCSNASHNGGSIATTNGVDAKASTISAVRIQ